VNDILAVITVDKASLNDASILLSSLGVKSTILTIDGGTSTFLFEKNAGLLEKPGRVDNPGKSSFTKLPHYVVFKKLD